MPYIYSLAWRVTNEDYTIQRPLVMDWRTDAKTRDIGDEFMFGPSILVSPVLQANASRRTCICRNRQSGTTSGPERPRRAALKLMRMLLSIAFRLYVRAGSILPLGPEIEYADEKPKGPIELRIYRGADGKFDLYQDAGDSYDYEKGAHALIPLRWSEATRTLTIGERHGNYPNMPANLQFNVSWVSAGHGSGPAVAQPDKTIEYTGKEISVKAP